MEKELGKITNAYFGIGGYQDAQLGLHLVFQGGCVGCSTNHCTWDYNIIENTETSNWGEEDRSQRVVEIVRKVSNLLHQAKVKKVSDLKGIPVEMIFENQSLKDYRILTEVL